MSVLTGARWEKGGPVPWVGADRLDAPRADLKTPCQLYNLDAVAYESLLLGLFTRPVAFVLAGEMAVAYFQFHHPKAFWPIVNGGVSAALYCFIWLYLSAAGPGPWSVDAKRR